MSSKLCEREECDAFRIALWRNTSDGAQVSRGSLDELGPHKTRALRFVKWSGLKNPTVECVEWIVAGEVMFATPFEELIVEDCQLPIGDCRLVCRINWHGTLV
jgi:hypothetical protein